MTLEALYRLAEAAELEAQGKYMDNPSEATREALRAAREATKMLWKEVQNERKVRDQIGVVLA